MGAETITPQQLAEWQRVTDAATAGPWTVERDWTWEVTGNGLTAKLLHEADARFIALARTAMPLLLAEVARLREESAAWRACSDGNCPTPADLMHYFAVSAAVQADKVAELRQARADLARVTAERDEARAWGRTYFDSFHEAATALALEEAVLEWMNDGSGMLLGPPKVQRAYKASRAARDRREQSRAEAERGEGE